MVLPGAAQVRIFAPKKKNNNNGENNNNNNNNKTVQNWTLPGWILTSPSISVNWLLGDMTQQHPTILHTRVAKTLGIENGDVVEFEFVEIGERFSVPVSLKDDFSAAFFISGAVTPLRIAESSTTFSTKTILTMHNGKELILEQECFWEGIDFEDDDKEDSFAVLEFDGASRNNSDGPSGYGYCARQADSFGNVLLQNDNDNNNNAILIQGYGYSPSGGSNNQMEYAGLFEGLWWAVKLNVKKLWVRGDSELVIQQINSASFWIFDAALKEYHSKIKALVKKAGMEIVFEHIPRESNVLADALANLGIDLKENATSVKWINCNKL